MQVELNPDGSVNREYRPYIFGEETTYNYVLYDPFQGPQYGLYSGPQYIFPPWRSHVSDFFTKVENSNAYAGVMPCENLQNSRTVKPPYDKYATSVAPGGLNHYYRRLYAT